MKESMKDTLLVFCKYFILQALASIVFGSMVIGILYCHNKEWPSTSIIVIIYALYILLPAVISTILEAWLLFDESITIRLVVLLCTISVGVIELRFPFSIVVTLI